MKSQIEKNLKKETDKILVETIILGKKNPAWEKIIKKVSGSRRKRLELNLDEIDNQTKDNDLVIIPGRVLGKGNIKKKIKISAMKYTESAKEKLKESKIEFNLIEEEIKSNPEGKGIKVLTNNGR